MFDASSAPLMPLNAVQRWLYSWWPSRRLGFDPQENLQIDGRYVPVSIANWKLIPPIARQLLSQRSARPLTFENGRRLSVIVPFRDRDAHLTQLVPALSNQLRSQSIEPRILVVEQTNPGPFNRGRLLNIGAHFAADESDYFCLHDVDAIPLQANYLCPSQPLRLVNRIVTEQGEQHRERHYFSGAISIRKEQFFAANGFSNEYWGWGKEDDDFFFRLLMAGHLCYFDLQGRFKDLPNPPAQQRTPKSAAVDCVKSNRKRRSRLLRGLDDPMTDGVNTLRYEVSSRRRDGELEIVSVRW